MGETHVGRKVLRIGGADREHFLQGLVSNNVTGLSALTYAAILTPQGKFIADFFLLPDGESILLDCAAEVAPGLLMKLKMYKLRAAVTLEETPLYAIRGIGDMPEDGWPDPRHAALGWRAYRTKPGDAPTIDWNAIRVEHCIPESGTELGPDSYILEAGFERLNGVSFRKGCYVGQEVTARMKHKTELRKGFVTVSLDGPAEPGTAITLEDGREVGKLHTISGGEAIAYLRFDRAKGPLKAGDAVVTWTP